MGDVAKIVQELGEPVERNVARFRTVTTKCSTIMIERDYVRLVQDGLLWSLRKHFLGIRLTNLHHLSFKVARYERARVVRVLSKA